MSAAIAIRRSRLARPRVSRAARIQIGIFLLAYLLYSAARYFTVGDLDQAKVNANWILDLEHHVGVADEGSIQDALTGTFWLWLLNHAYLAAQLVVLPGSLIFLYHRSRPVYERLRNTILATWLISLPVYALFPVAPPRLADIGMVDTITHQTGVALDSGLTTSFYNELAAVPSLHVGFAVAIGIALAAAFRHPVAKAISLMWGPIIGLAVVATGNHFVFDIAAGVVAAALGYLLGAALTRPAVRRAPSMRPAFADA